MSVPAQRMDAKGRNGQPQSQAGPAQQEIANDSHAHVHAGIQALAGAAAKMGAGAAAPHPELMAALRSLHDKVDTMGQGGPGGPDGQGGDPYANMPDPGGWVEQDPQGAAAYADAILNRFAALMAEHAAAPAGPPMAGPEQTGPAVGGMAGPAY